MLTLGGHFVSVHLLFLGKSACDHGNHMLDRYGQMEVLGIEAGTVPLVRITCTPVALPPSTLGTTYYVG